MSAPITAKIVRHDLANAEIIADLYIDGDLVLEGQNLVGEGAANFDPVASGDDDDLRARASRRAKGTRAWRVREVERVSPTLSFGLGGKL